MSMLLAIGGVFTVFAFSALNSYEEMDQDVPLIVWPTVALSLIGWSMVSYALWQQASTTGSWARWLALLIVPAMAVGLLIHRFVGRDGSMAESVWDVLSFGGLALAVGAAGGTLRSYVMAATGAGLLVLAKNVLLPYESRAQTVYGPAMALLPIAWALLILAVRPSTLPQQPVMGAQVAAYTVPVMPAVMPTVMPAVPNAP